jgi:hypothetical protein
MTPGDVIAEIIGMHEPSRFSRDDPDDQGVAIVVWGALAKQLKPDQEYMPMSPEEQQRARLILKGLLDAFDAAKARKPGHFRPVEPGGR